MKSGMLAIMSFLVAFGISGMSGCSPIDFGHDKADIESLSPAQIFQKGEVELERNNNEKGALFFGEIERLYPYSEWAKRGLIMQAFAFHRDKKYDESRAASTRFVDFYPADDDVAYAKYLFGLSYYDQIDDVGRDQGVTRKALQAFRELFEQYPKSEYSKSAKLKFDLAFDHLASKEMEVGRYYLKDAHYSSAINRFRLVVEDFKATSHTAEALHRLVEAYLSLGLFDEAQTAGAILGQSYEASDWYKNSYNLLETRGLSPTVKGKSWLSRVHRQVIKGQWL
tara:strand:- start:303 stop:1148 length:846 start_codon:yes stop_codon:yes gene_type:complete